MERHGLLWFFEEPRFGRHADRHSHLLIVGGSGAVGDQDLARLQPFEKSVTDRHHDNGWRLRVACRYTGTGWLRDCAAWQARSAWVTSLRTFSAIASLTMASSMVTSSK